MSKIIPCYKNNSFDDQGRCIYDDDGIKKHSCKFNCEHYKGEEGEVCRHSQGVVEKQTVKIISKIFECIPIVRVKTAEDWLFEEACTEVIKQSSWVTATGIHLNSFAAYYGLKRMYCGVLEDDESLRIRIEKAIYVLRSENGGCEKMNGIKECVNYLIDHIDIIIENETYIAWFDGDLLLVQRKVDPVTHVSCGLKEFNKGEWSVVRKPVHFFDHETDVIYIDKDGDYRIKRLESKVVMIHRTGLMPEKLTYAKESIDWLTGMKWYKEEVK